MKSCFLLYCAGPITGHDFSKANDWRDYVASKLKAKTKNSFPIVVLSPLRGKDYLKNEKELKDAYEEHPLSSQKGIAIRDFYDVKRADMVLANFLGAQKISIGTIMEIAWAYAWRIPIVVIMEENNPHNHAMIREIALVVSNLDEAIEIVKRILLP